jgi:malonyl-CoA O-methyltransferase
MSEPRAPLDVAEGYDEWAPVYDADANRARDLAATVLRTAPLSLAGRAVLELGCGTGANTAWLAERAASVVGLDLSREMLRRATARVRAAHVRFVQHDIRTPWPVDSGSVDVVIAMLVLEHVEHLGPVFAEAARVLGRGGEALVCEFHPARQWQGRQAGFTDPRTGEAVRVAAFVHDTADYVEAALAAGLDLSGLGEWRDPGAERTAVPRLLSLRAVRA